MAKDLNIAYENQRRSAAFRGIDWLFTFNSWLEWWQSTGKLELRGNTKSNPYMMCRIKDCGPYSPDNVYCGTTTQNNNDAWLHNPNHKTGGLANLSKKQRSEIGRFARSKVKTVTTLHVDEIKSRLDKIAHINLQKYGWVCQVANELEISHTQARRFINKYYTGDIYTRAKP